MGAPQSVDRERLDQLLCDSVSQQRALVLTHHGADGWRTIKATFSGGSAHARVLRVRGMINSIPHLVRIVEARAAKPAKKA